LGWSLGANNAANIFGPAVGTRMVRFKVAATVASIFVILGAVISGAGAADTLGALGAVNALAGSFTVALAAAATVSWMTRVKIPVSASQAVVGGIIGWNLFTGSPTDFNSLTKIFISWVSSPILAAIFSLVIFRILKFFLDKSRVHLLEVDIFNRIGLILVGAFGAYSLGANNIANVMGVFVPASPFKSLSLGSLFALSGTQQLFFLGGLAIAIGIFTYSYRVMITVGNEIFHLTPVAALVVVLAESMVLFMFASQTLQKWLLSAGLPPIPLVPISSSQAAIGAVIGIALAKGGKGINYGVLGKIASGWITTPISATILTFVALFFVQNVFEMQVIHSVDYKITPGVLSRLAEEKIPPAPISPLTDKSFHNPVQFRSALQKYHDWSENQLSTIFKYAQKDSFNVQYDSVVVHMLTPKLSEKQIRAVKLLNGMSFSYKWQLNTALENAGESWRPRNGTEATLFNEELRKQKEAIFKLFSVPTR